MITRISLAIVALITLASCKSTENRSDKTTSQAKLEEYRPVYHFTAPKNWINDPNGLVYLDGEYHLFYQYNPFGNDWGHMSWGHAVSSDLTSWENLPTAIEEFQNKDKDSTLTMIFSGSVVVDSENTSGLFAEAQKDGMVAIFTSHVHNGKEGLAQHQSLAYSLDRGRTWKLYDKNPVLDLGMKDFRDPNVFWYAPQQKWIMAVVKPLEYMVQFYESKDLKVWKLMSEFGNRGDVTKIWECPALFEVPVHGSSEKKWVLSLSSGHRQKNFLAMQYFVGDFDGKSFTAQKQEEVLYVDEGKDFYAGIPFNNLPPSHKKPVMIGWINDWEYAGKIPTSPFKGAMSVPREMALKNTSAGYRLVQNPVSMTKRYGKSIRKQNLKVAEAVLLEMKGEAYEITTKINLGTAKKTGIRLLKSKGEETVVSYDIATGMLSVDRTKSGNVSFSPRFPSIEQVAVQPENGILTLHILVDRSIVEVFANDGMQVLTDFVFPTRHEGAVELFAEGGEAIFTSFQMREIR
jgi:fructan beta-fructosidase